MIPVHITSVYSLHPAPLPDLYLKDIKIQPVKEHINEKPKENTGKGKGKKLLCSMCANPITDTSQIAHIDNKHIHDKINPQGFIFTIGCFEKAPGCISNGSPSTFFTWFSGYSWQHQVCNNCATPMGWRFHSSDHSFYGLIMDHLVEDEG